MSLPWPAGLILFGLLVTLCYLAAVAGFSSRTQKPDLAQASASAALGLAALGFAILLTRWVSISTALCFALLAGAALVALYRRRTLAIPGAKQNLSLTGTWVMLGSALAFVSPTIFGALTMGLGKYPDVFFAAATPFRLTHAYQFIEDRGLPPLSLSNLGIRTGYHYAAPAIASAVALFTHLPVHSSFFLTLIAISVGTAAMAYLLAELAPGRLPYALGFCFILGAAPRTVWGIGKSFKHWFDDPQLFLNNFPDISILTGTFLFLVTLYACLDLKRPRNVVLALVSTVLLSADKSSFFATGGIVLFAGTLVQLYRSRDWRWLLLPLVAFLAGYGILQSSGSVVTTSLKIEPFFFFKYSGKKALKYGLDMILFALPLLIYLWASRPRIAFPQETKDRMLMIGLAILGLYFFLNMLGNFHIAPDGDFTADENILQPIKLLPKLMAVLVVLGLAALWDPEKRRLNRIVGALLALMVVFPLGHRLTQAVILVVNPEAGHEYVDNRPIAEALAAIPVDGSVIVTNDLRYPANDFKRDLRQMQIPAMFGHQAYAANTLYERYPDSERRVQLQRRFAADKWDPELAKIAKQEGWTHLLIHKLAPYPDDIPLTKIFENQRYIVYAFE